MTTAAGQQGRTGGGERATGTPADGPASDRVRVRRLPDRGRYDRHLIASILDEGFVCHLGFSSGGTTWVLPMAYGRHGADLYLHGATGNHALRTLRDGAEATVAVTLIDGLVLAKAAFHHSVNYRSVMLLGPAHAVVAPEEKRLALEVVVSHIVPGRTADARPPTDPELRAVTVLRMAIDEASAKVRTGGPVDDAEDRTLPIWSGVIPLTPHAGVPMGDEWAMGIEPPAYARAYRRPG
jgi:nitroimidazol reductase NimA-like FMN-containing flavoprotein (pyridoxamine 5'-phosphate oxidase superfamily)